MSPAFGDTGRFCFGVCVTMTHQVDADYICVMHGHGGACVNFCYVCRVFLFRSPTRALFSVLGAGGHGAGLCVHNYLLPGISPLG